MQSDDVKVKCRQCGGEARASEFVLDPDFKMMVCPNCVRQKGVPKKTEQAVKKEQAVSNKPKDWDADDEALEKLYRQKQATKKPNLTEGMKLKCKKCDYVFVFKGTRQCPYCNTDF